MAEINKIKKLLNFKMPAKYDRVIHAAMLLLFAFGTIMLMSVNTSDAQYDKTAVIKTLLKQIAFFGISYVGLLFMAKIFNLKRAKKFILYYLGVCIFLVIYTFMIPNQYGIQAWISLKVPVFGTVTLQPTELIKPGIIVLLATQFGMLYNNVDYSPSDVYPITFGLLLIIMILVFKQSDFGTLAIMMFCAAMELLLVTHPVLKNVKRATFQLCILGIALLGFFTFSPLGLALLKSTSNGGLYKIYVRVAGAQNPFLDVSNSGWQIVQGLNAFYKGGWFGVGLGNSTLKYGYLPTSSTDSILPIVVEETGILGFSIIAILYFIIIYRLLRYGMKEKILANKMILIGVASYFFIHFVLNVGGVSALIPFTGVPLLFISSGGSSLLTSMLSLGICQSIISKQNLEKKNTNS